MWILYVELYAEFNLISPALSKPSSNFHWIPLDIKTFISFSITLYPRNNWTKGRQSCHNWGHSLNSWQVFGNLGEEDFHPTVTLHDHRQRQKLSNSNSYINFLRILEVAIAVARVKLFSLYSCYQMRAIADSQLYAKEKYWASFLNLG
jgi:hypothetical protein